MAVQQFPVSHISALTSWVHADTKKYGYSEIDAYKVLLSGVHVWCIGKEHCRFLCSCMSGDSGHLLFFTDIVR
jgi:hypothetical protein